MSSDSNKIGIKEANEAQAQHNKSDKESAKVNEITIVIRGGQIVKFEQRFV